MWGMTRIPVTRPHWGSRRTVPLPELPTLTTTEWEDIAKRLVVYAQYKVAKLRWRGQRGKDAVMPGGHTAESIAQDAILSVFAGTRACTAANGAELLRALMSIVDSIVSHEVNSAENRTMRREPLNRDGEGSDVWHPSASRNDDPLQSIANRDGVFHLRQDIRDRLDKDPEALRVFECLDANITQPSEIAVLMEVKVTDVNNAQKRLRRTVAAILQEPRKAHGQVRPIR